MSSIQRQARNAGWLYLAMGIVAPIGLMYVPGRLIVRGDALATAERIRASESLFRIGIASELIHQALAVFLVLALYRMFKPVDVHRARQMVALGALVSVPIMFVNSVFSFATLVLVSGPDFLAAFGPGQRDALAYLFLRLHSIGIDVASIFWGLWLFPFGALIIRSGFFPRVLGILTMIAGAGYLIAAAASVLAPAYGPAVGRVALVMEMGELPIILWLVIFGARERPGTAAPSTATAAAR